MHARIHVWIARYRRTVVLSAVRGVSYGAGTTAVSLVVIWARHRY